MSGGGYKAWADDEISRVPAAEMAREKPGEEKKTKMGERSQFRKSRSVSHSVAGERERKGRARQKKGRERDGWRDGGLFPPPSFLPLVIIPFPRVLLLLFLPFVLSERPSFISPPRVGALLLLLPFLSHYSACLISYFSGILLSFVAFMGARDRARRRSLPTLGLAPLGLQSPSFALEREEK